MVSKMCRRVDYTPALTIVMGRCPNKGKVRRDQNQHISAVLCISQNNCYLFWSAYYYQFTHTAALFHITIHSRIVRNNKQNLNLCQTDRECVKLPINLWSRPAFGKATSCTCTCHCYFWNMEIMDLGKLVGNCPKYSMCRASRFLFNTIFTDQTESYNIS